MQWDDRSMFSLGWFKSLKSKNICFNLRPFSNPIHLKNSSVTLPEQVVEKTFVDLHLEVAQKVDALIAMNEKSLMPEFEEISFAPEKPMHHVGLNPEQTMSTLKDEI